MIQEIIAYIILGVAVAFLVKKFFFKKKKKKKGKDCGSDDCGCN
jgi:large-conductance mechanosensitive channel